MSILSHICIDWQKANPYYDSGMKFSFLVAITLIVILLACGAYAFWGNKTEIKNYPSKNTAIVAFGDSLIEGVGATKGSDLVSLLAQKTGKEIINLGVSGNTTEQGLARIKEVVDLKPKVTIVLLGGNDYLRKIPEDQTFKNLEQIITQIQKILKGSYLYRELSDII